jgi:hypothetical protein
LTNPSNNSHGGERDALVEFCVDHKAILVQDLVIVCWTSAKHPLARRASRLQAQPFASFQCELKQYVVIRALSMCNRYICTTKVKAPVPKSHHSFNTRGYTMHGDGTTLSFARKVRAQHSPARYEKNSETNDEGEEALHRRVAFPRAQANSAPF